MRADVIPDLTRLGEAFRLSPRRSLRRSLGRGTAKRRYGATTAGVAWVGNPSATGGPLSLADAPWPVRALGSGTGGQARE